MPSRLVDSLDLELAWKRLKLDRPDRVFVTHPFLINWIDDGLETWLDGIREKILRFEESTPKSSTSGLSASTVQGYAPRPGQPCLVPKSNGLTRPGCILEIEDELIYNALVGAAYNKIYPELVWSQGNPRTSHPLAANPKEPQWIGHWFNAWKVFMKKSLQKMRGMQFMVISDITAFYETIELSRLFSYLNALGVDSSVLRLLSTCLNKWAGPRGRGIPFGYSSSDILAELYLNYVDKPIQESGFEHLRYADDFRLFCSDKLQAKKAVLLLESLLRERGLNVQPAKTDTLPATEAIREIQGVTPIIESIEQALPRQFRNMYPSLGSYPSPAEIDRFFEGHPAAPPPPILEAAFRDYFINKADGKFDERLFRYLLTWLRRVRSRMAVDYSINVLINRPQETGSILRYLGKVTVEDGKAAEITRFAGSPEAIYEYQLFEIARWFYERGRYPPDLIDLYREVAFNRSRPSWLRSYALAILGRGGTMADLERIESKYVQTSTELEKAEYARCLERMEKGRRNAFYGRIAGEGEMVRRAIRQAKAVESSSVDLEGSVHGTLV